MNDLVGSPGSERSFELVGQGSVSELDIKLLNCHTRAPLEAATRLKYSCNSGEAIASKPDLSEIGDIATISKR